MLSILLIQALDILSFVYLIHSLSYFIAKTNVMKMSVKNKSVCAATISFTALINSVSFLGYKFKSFEDLVSLEQLRSSGFERWLEFYQISCI
jgi:hypothetical protein